MLAYRSSKHRLLTTEAKLLAKTKRIRYLISYMELSFSCFLAHHNMKFLFVTEKHTEKQPKEFTYSLITNKNITNDKCKAIIIRHALTNTVVTITTLDVTV